MKFDHMVKFNGVYYPVGAEVPMGEKPVVETKSEHKTEAVTKTVSAGITREEIEAMNNVMKLRKVAKEHRISVPQDASLKELKELMYTALNL